MSIAIKSPVKMTPKVSNPKPTVVSPVVEAIAEAVFGETTPVAVKPATPVVPVKVTPTPTNKANLYDVNIAEAVKENFTKIFQDGFLVNLRISVWGMCVNLDEKDLKLDKKVSKLIKLGKKMLIEPEHLNEFKNMESKARRYVYRNSFDFPVADAHFVPKKRLSEVLTKLEEFKGEFNTLVTAFVENYDTHKQTILDNPEYADIVDVLKPLYPSAEDVAKKFGFSVSVFELSMPQAMEETNIQKLIAGEEAKTEVKNALAEQLRAQHEHSLELLEKFTEDAAIALRGKLVTMCSTIIDKIKNKELISKANINTIAEEIENFRSLNFLSDTAIEKEIAKLEVLITGNNNFKTDQETIDTLSQTLGDVLAKAESVTDVADISGKYFRKIKV